MAESGVAECDMLGVDVDAGEMVEAVVAESVVPGREWLGAGRDGDGRG